MGVNKVTKQAKSVKLGAHKRFLNMVLSDQCTVAKHRALYIVVNFFFHLSSVSLPYSVQASTT